jgi:predicted ester cyclase
MNVPKFERYRSENKPYRPDLKTYVPTHRKLIHFFRAIPTRRSTMSNPMSHLLRRTVLVAGLGLAVLAGGQVAAGPLSPEKAAEQAAVAKRFYGLINGGDAAAWRAVVAEGWKATPPMPSKPNEIGGYEAVIGAFRAGFPDLKVEQVEIVANEDVVAVRSRVTGTNTAPLFGQPATGKPVTFTAMDIHRIKDGRIVETWHVEDLGGMQRQLSGR